MSTGPGPHPSPEELDRLAATRPDDPAADDPAAHGSLTPGTAEHVATCATCRAAVAGLRDVGTLLRAERARPPAVPAEVRRRLAAALAAEAARRPPAPGRASGRASGRGPSPAARVPAAGAPRPPRWLAAAAALVVLGGAAVTATQLLDPTGQQAGEQAGEQATGQDEQQDEQQEAGQAAERTQPAQRPPAAATAGPGADDDPRALAGPGVGGDAVVPLATGTSYAPAPLTAQVRALLAAAPGGPAGSTVPDTASTPSAPGTVRSARLPACLRALGPPATAPLAVDLARWRGSPATVVVVRDDAGRGLRVLVAGAGCGAGGADLLHDARVAP